MTNSKVNLKDILEVLRELDGYVVIKHKGEEFIITRRQEEISEQQLALPEVPVMDDQAMTADDILEKINRDIALFQLQQEEEEDSDEFALEPEIEEMVEESAETIRPPRRVRFEPLRGDLPPDLQG